MAVYWLYARLGRDLQDWALKRQEYLISTIRSSWNSIFGKTKFSRAIQTDPVFVRDKGIDAIAITTEQGTDPIAQAEEKSNNIPPLVEPVC